MLLGRRQFLASAAASALAANTSFAAPGTTLRVEHRDIQVNGRTKQVYALRQPNGTPGLTLGPRDRFRVQLVSAIRDPVVVHWHGQEPPSAQDGVPELSQYPIPPGTAQYYDFAPRPGTHWMHSHLGFQEQDLLAAPLIVRTAEDERADLQEVVVMLHDFTFQLPEAILAALGGLPNVDPHAGHAGHMGHSMPGMEAPPAATPAPVMDHSQHMMMGGAGAAMDLNDIQFDAYLANDRTLDDPEIVRVEAGGRVRLRLINAAAGTNFFIDTGSLEAFAVAVDGNPIEPAAGRRFPLAIAQRLDLIVRLPAGQGAWPIIAQREGEKELTGIVLATARGSIRRLSGMEDTAAGPLGEDHFERHLVPVTPLPLKPVDRRIPVRLTGTMSPYAWSMSGHESGENLPIEVKYGERVELALRNDSGMAHPIHLHGHHFQVVGWEQDGVKSAHRGAVRDTVLVPTNSTVTVAFDALNAGRWAFHCHMLYHQATGMMSELRYRA